MSTYAKVVPLSPQDRMFKLATHKVIITYAELASLGAGASLTVQVFPGQTPRERDAGTVPTGVVPVGTRVRFAGFELVTAFDFSDAAINSLLLRLGDGNVTNRFLVDKELAVDGTEILEWVETATTQPYAYPITDGLDVVIVAAGGGTPTVQEATSGEVHLYLHITQPNARAK